MNCRSVLKSNVKSNIQRWRHWHCQFGTATHTSLYLFINILICPILAHPKIPHSLFCFRYFSCFTSVLSIDRQIKVSINLSIGPSMVSVVAGRSVEQCPTFMSDRRQFLLNVSIKAQFILWSSVKFIYCIVHSGVTCANGYNMILFYCWLLLCAAVSIPFSSRPTFVSVLLYRIYVESRPVASNFYPLTL